MWPFSLFKKLSQDPAVGQPRGDYIGCYLLGTHTSGRDDDISYISLATTREQLEQDARQYLQEFLEQHPQLNEAERLALQDQGAVAPLPARLLGEGGQHGGGILTGLAEWVVMQEGLAVSHQKNSGKRARASSTAQRGSPASRQRRKSASRFSCVTTESNSSAER